MARDGLDDTLRPIAGSSRERRDGRALFARPRGLRLPESSVREPFDHRGQRYRLNGDDTRMLATVGAFRVVAMGDLDRQDVLSCAGHGSLRHLANQGLVERNTVVIHERLTVVVVLTRDGKSLLESGWDTGSPDARQQFHAGLVKPRDVAHDSQLFRLYQHAASHLEADGHRVERVVLDCELKHDYHSFLNRADRSPDLETDMRAFAEARQLSIVDGHLALPDLRIEYATPDGQVDLRDVELLTEHYSRVQVAGKAKAGFSLYRASGSARVRGGSTRAGGMPLDPHHLERLL